MSFSGEELQKPVAYVGALECGIGLSEYFAVAVLRAGRGQQGRVGAGAGRRNGRTSRRMRTGFVLLSQGDDAGAQAEQR